MSISNKIVASYSKSIFQSTKNFILPANSLAAFEIANMVQPIDPNSFRFSDVYSIGEELTLLRSLFISSKKFSEFFQNPTYSEQQKLALLLDVFPGISITLRAFLKILSERGHLVLLPQIEQEYHKLFSKLKNSTSIRFLTASSLPEEYGSNLLTTLRTITGSNEIFLNVSYSPKLLGGFILEYNSVSIDVSILREFSSFFQNL